MKYIEWILEKADMSVPSPTHSSILGSPITDRSSVSVHSLHDNDEISRAKSPSAASATSDHIPILEDHPGSLKRSLDLASLKEDQEQLLLEDTIISYGDPEVETETQQDPVGPLVQSTPVNIVEPEYAELNDDQVVSLIEDTPDVDYDEPESESLRMSELSDSQNPILPPSSPRVMETIEESPKKPGVYPRIGWSPPTGNSGTPNSLQKRKKKVAKEYSILTRCSIGFAKLCLFLCNFIIWLCSLCMIAFGAYTVLDFPFITPYISYKSMLLLSFLFFGFGGIALLVALLGCCGSINSGKWILKMYIIATFVFIVSLIGCSGAGWVFVRRTEAQAIQDMVNYIKLYNNTLPAFSPGPNEDWNVMQRSLECCGVLASNDWSIYKAGFRGAQRMPVSCCKLNPNNQLPLPGCIIPPFANGAIHTTGCYQRASQVLNQYFLPITGIVLSALSIVIILGLLFAILACSKM